MDNNKHIMQYIQLLFGSTQDGVPCNRIEFKRHLRKQFEQAENQIADMIDHEYYGTQMLLEDVTVSWE